MAKICQNCKTANPDTADFCQNCGQDLEGAINTSTQKSQNGAMGWWNKQSTGGKAAIGILGICCIGLIILIAFVGMFSPDNTANPQQTNTSQPRQAPLKIADVYVQNEGAGMYTLTCSLTPSKNYDYLEMVLKWYDSNGVVLDRTVLAWNINDAKAGETYQVEAMATLNGDKRPSTVDIMLFDTPFGGGSDSDAIYKTHITINWK